MSAEEALTAPVEGRSVNGKDYTHLNPTVDKARGPSTFHQIMLLVGCCWVRCVARGPGFALSVIYVVVIKFFDAPRKEASLTQSLFTMVLYGTSFPVSFIIARFGPGPTVMMGAVLATAGFLISAFWLESIFGIIVGTGIIGGMGSSMLATATYTAVAWSFRGRKSLALVMSSFGSSAGMFIYPYIAQISLQYFCLRGAFIVLACMSATAMISGIDLQAYRRHYVKGNEDTGGVIHMSALRRPIFWIVQLGVALVGFSTIDPYILVDMVQGYGFNRADGTWVATAFGFAGLMGKLLALALARVTGVPTISFWSVCCLVIGIVHTVLLFANPYWLLMLVSAASGICWGVIQGTIAVVVLETSGLKCFPIALGTTQLALGGSFFAGIFFSGCMKDRGWNYNQIYHVLIGVLAAAAALCLGVAVYTRKRPTDIGALPLQEKDEEVEAPPEKE